MTAGINFFFPLLEVILVKSEAVLLLPFESPLQLTVPMLVTLVGLFVVTFTVSVIGGRLVPPARESVLVQVRDVSAQFQPSPPIPVAVNPAGRVSLTTTVLLLGDCTQIRNCDRIAAALFPEFASPPPLTIAVLV